MPIPIKTQKLGLGMRVSYQEKFWQVMHMDGVEVRLTNTAGETLVLPFLQFVQLPSVQRLQEEQQATPSSDMTLNGHLDTLFESLSQPLKAGALQRLEHLREALTGYRSGDRARAEEHEPRPNYNPDATTEKKRFIAKAAELTEAGMKVSARTLRFQRDEYLRRGLMALVDARKLKGTLPFGRHSDAIIGTAKQVVEEATDASTVTKKLHIEKIQSLLKADLNAGRLPLQQGLPSYASFSRLLDKLSKNRYTYGSAKLRRSIAGRPMRQYQMLTPTRVGEYVVIDASTYDVWGFDSLTGKKVRHRLVVAIDVYSRCILSARFFENDPNGIDVTFMLHDIIVPKVAPPGWSEKAFLPYIGLPEALIIALHDLPADANLKGLPFARPDNLVIDNGKIFISEVFESACERLGISLIIARPYTGNDKAHVERFFETARDSFCVYLQGYTGNNPMNKGANPEAEAYYFRHELEDDFHEWLASYYHLQPHSGLKSHVVPEVKLAPIEVFRAGMEAAGYLHIPTDRNLYQQLLETQWREIHPYGVDFYGILYDAPELLPLRNTSCPYSLKNSRWPFKVDRRDLRYLHFQLPDSGEWIRLTRRDAKAADAPFTAVHLELARERVVAEGFSPRDRKRRAAALEALLTEQRGRVAQNTAQRAREVKALHQMEQAMKDEEQANRAVSTGQPMALAEPIPATVNDVPHLNPAEGFGGVDKLEENAVNVFARGKGSFWKRSKT